MELTQTILNTNKMTTYKQYNKTFGKQEFRVIVATGKHNEVMVAKVTHLARPFYKSFPTFEKAIENYKNANIKLMLELISIGMFTESFETIS